MSETLATLEADATTLAIRGDAATAASAVDALATYELAADLCAAAMTKEPGRAAEVEAAVESIGAASAARKAIIRGGAEGTDLERQLLSAAITACERSEALCGPHASHHDHCRRHTAAAREAAAAARVRLAELG